MSKLEEIKKILEKHRTTYQGVDYVHASPAAIEALCLLICSLEPQPEPKQDELDIMFKVKPDAGRLLSQDVRCDIADGVNKLIPTLSIKQQNAILNLISETAKAQLALDQEHERATLLRIKREIETHTVDSNCHGGWWQEFWKKETPELEVRHSEIVKQLQTTFGPLSDNTSLAQPSPLRVYPTIVTYSAYEEPILG